MEKNHTSGPVLRALVRSILGGLSLVNVILLLASSSVDSRVITLSCTFFGIVTTLLYFADVSGRLKVGRKVPLAIIFVNSCVIAFCFDLNPAPIFIFMPSFICSAAVLHQKSSIRLASILHVVAVLVSFFRGDGTVELSFMPYFLFGVVLVIFFVASYLAFVSNRKYFYNTTKLEKLIVQKQLAIEIKSSYLNTRSSELKSSHARLYKRIVENSDRVLHLKVVNEELELIAKAASDDMKTPLKAIKRHVEQLGDRLSEFQLKEGFAEYLTYINDGASRMDAMLDDLLQYCDPSVRDSTNKSCTKEVLNIIDSNLSNLLLRENAKLIVDENMPIIPGHKTEILQLFQNLITNGIKFRKPGVDPICRVGFSHTEDDILFHVSDNGIGIPANRVNDVFGLFTRLHERGNYEGTGIGLALCRRIVLAAGGKIWAESTEGEGTTFYFTWPLVSKPIEMSASLHDYAASVGQTSVA